MNKNILKTGVQEFIQNNLDTDIVSVLLKNPIFEGVSQKELAEQLESKKKAKNKLPKWFSTSQIYYPKKIHIEQTSSEKTALYKAGLVSGKTLLDVTGGFGVDSYFFAQKMEGIIHCEMNSNLSEIAAYNFKKIGIKNIEFKRADGVEFLRKSKTNFDWIFIDPSRRNEIKGKVFLLKDCLPNVPQHLDLIFQSSQNLMLKTSPLLDINQGINELQFVKEIHIIAVKNEVKELLWILEKDFANEISINTINLQKDNEQTFGFTLSEEKEVLSEFAAPQDYLYEPNASIMKSGGFKIVGKAFGLQKIHEHSHLYTSDSLIEFPGRRFKIQNCIAYNKKELRKLAISQANITVRNFPDAVATIRKKIKIKDGGETYLFFTTNSENQSIILKCLKPK